MKNIVVFSLLFSLSGTTIASSSSVNNGHNDGPGSLRAALASGASSIYIAKDVSTIFVSEPLIYSSYKALKIRGTGQTIDGSAIQGDGDILSITQGADTLISGIDFVGNAGEINPDPRVPIGGKGIDLTVPPSRVGLVKLVLDSVNVARVGHHGVHVSDCTLGDECGAGSGGGGDGSPASIKVKLNNVHINQVGFGRADADGLRVDDRGDGDIYFTALNSKFTNVGADGVELDEGNSGDVVVDVRRSFFDGNGEYCNLIPVFVGGPCDDDGDRDVDDGFDIDEAGPGKLYARISNTDVTNNFDEGLDFDTEDSGGAEVLLSRVFALGNQDEGFKLSEEGSGDVEVYLRRFTSVDNNGDSEGIEIEEENEGNVSVFVNKVNMIGDVDEQLKIEQMDGGIGTVRVKNSAVVLDLDGVEEL